MLFLNITYRKQDGGSGKKKFGRERRAFKAKGRKEELLRQREEKKNVKLQKMEKRGNKAEGNCQ